MEQLESEKALYDLFVTFLNKYDDRGQSLVGEFLLELQYRFVGSRPAAPTQALLDALFAAGESIQQIDWRGDIMVLSPPMRAALLIRDMLASWTPAAAGMALKEAFRKAQSVSYCASVFVDRARELGEIPEEGWGRNDLISLGDFKILGDLLLPKIESAAAKGSLTAAPFYFDILRAWSYLAGEAKPRAWLSASVMESATFLTKTARGLLSYSVSGSERSYAYRDRPDSTVYDFEVLAAACERHASQASLSEDERSMINALKEGIERRPSGQSSAELDEDLDGN
jgi:hypothetical protein